MTDNERPRPVAGFGGQVFYLASDDPADLQRVERSKRNHPSNGNPARIKEVGDE